MPIVLSSLRPYSGSRVAKVLKGLLPLCVVFSAGVAQAQSVLAEYDFQEGSPTVPGKLIGQSNDTDPNSVASNRVFGAGLGPGVGTAGDAGPDVGNPSENTVPFANGATGSDANTPSLAAALSSGDYMSFTLTPNAGYVLNLTEFSFTAARVAQLGQTGGPTQLAVFSSVTGIPGPSLFTTTVTTNLPSTGGVFQAFSSSLSAADFQGVTGPIEFRIVFWGGTSGNAGALVVDNFIIRGTAAPVGGAVDGPEPGTFALLALGAIVGAGTTAARRKCGFARK